MSHVLTLLALSLLGTSPGDPAAKPSEVWAMTIHDALRVGFDNSEFAHVEPEGGPSGTALRIAPVDAERPAGAFKAEAMKLALAIETGYWSIARKNVDLTAASAAIGLAENALQRENAKIEIGHGNPDAVVEAQKRLDASRSGLAVAIKDLSDAERQFHALLGLPPEGRRIAPLSTPRDGELSLDWQTCLAEMKENSPAIADDSEKSAKHAAPVPVDRAITERFLPGLTQTAPLADPSPKDTGNEPKPNDDQAERIHRQTHELARYFLEVDANFKLFQRAKSQLSESLAKLEALRSDYEQGKAAPGAYLDAVNGWTKAVSTVADFKARYNTSTAAVALAKGTLLDRDGVTILPPRPSRTTHIDGDTP